MSERRLVTIALFVATFLVALDTSVVSTAMPTVIGQIGGIQLYSWVFSAYLLTGTVTVPIYGKLADLFGRKPVFLAAIAMFMVGSMLCGQAQTMEQLIVFRLLQGLGAGGVLPITQTVLGDVFPLEQRARITGLFSTVWGVAGLLGPAIGGFLTEHVSWRWVFYVNFPLCVLSMVLISSFLHEHLQRRRPSIDYIGAVTLAGAVALLLVGLQTSSGNPLVQVVLYVLAAVLVPVFIWQERRAPEPLVPLWLFRQRAIGVSTLGGLLLGVALYGQSTFLPPFVQGVMGASPTLSGFVLASSSISWPLASGLGGRLLLRWGFRAPCVLGGVVLTIGFGLLLTVTPESGLWAPAAISFVTGLGFGFYSVVIILAAQSSVGWQNRGVVTSANQFARNIGGTVGVSIAGAIFTAGVVTAAGTGVNPNEILSPEVRATLAAADLKFLQQVLADALRSVYVLFVGVAVLATVIAALLPGGVPQESSSSSS
ncbi:MAG TPA: MDR family MFS transporter [Chloroflexota bacterium]|nr:MDR family MFS transporter [Chloroflexota bacterium]